MPRLLSVRSLLAATLLATAGAQACHANDAIPPPAAPCGATPALASAEPPALAAPTAAEADAFVKAVNEQLLVLLGEADRAAWVKATHITDDTEFLEARTRERVMEFLTHKIKEGRRFEGVAGLAPETARMLYLLKFAAGLPAPDSPEGRAELAELSSRMEGLYGKGKHCSPKLKGKGRKDNATECLDLPELSNILTKERDWDLQLEAWRGWHDSARENRKNFQRFVDLGNQGARELGFADMGSIWKGRYDMTPEAFEAEMDRQWEAVRPLYERLHCFVRARLRKQYGAERIGPRATLPAHVMGNMWAQEWTALYPQLEPHKGKGQADITPALLKKKFDANRMAKTAEGFFVSLGLSPLPKTFWERSMFLKPRDREVVCHASAWDLGLSGDLRIKMCIEVNQEDFVTLHHELGHNYYYLYYHELPPLFQDGANDGFHEGIGDTLALSVTPGYLKQIGVLDEVKPSPEADLNLLMHRALEGIAFLPFGRLIDQWRFQVFSGAVKPEGYNAAWWALRKKYQGVAPSVERTEQDFDPGAKYHIPANVPYTRYFIARILQYQFHRALCRASGHTGPLYQCSIYGNKAAGEKLASMLKLGASKPWPEALQVMTGETAMDASAIVDYYQPLMDWMAKETSGEQCGWD